MYRRYHIQTSEVHDIAPFPSRFRVRVKKHRLAWLLLRETFEYRGDKKVVFSRPCVYGVFSGPVGGFAPREQMCVGCLRCTTQYPEMVRILPNPDRQRLGDSFFTPEHIETVHYEAQAGRVPVKGAGYRGPFGGEGWNGMWTDMSEIVRPTRDGIHGREFISTAVDIGSIPAFLSFDANGKVKRGRPRTFSLPLPILFDVPPATALSQTLVKILSRAAEETETLFLLPVAAIQGFGTLGRHIVPVVSPGEEPALRGLNFQPQMIELAGWDEAFFRQVEKLFPASAVCLRLGFGASSELLARVRDGVRVFHLVADHHGRTSQGEFVLDGIREAHLALVDKSWRDQVTLVGSGGIIAAEHVPKAVICGLDAVALDTPLLVALQAAFRGECADRERSRFALPTGLEEAWGVQRVKNLLASWRDQLLEVLGAMGIREVRRLRGEMGRAMFQADLEKEAFSGIEGYALGK